MKETAYKITIDNTFSFDIASTVSLDSIPIGKNRFHILHGNKSYQAELISINRADKTVVLRLNGTTYHASIADPLDQMVNRMGLSVAAASKISDIKAPMPGLVLSVQVQEGQEVQHGEPLLVLEAMKMENLIKSPGSGRVKRIHVSNGNTVEKNQLLIELE